MNRYSNWFWTVLCWDGLLPVTVIAAPHLVSLLLPRRPGALEMTFVVVPIVAFLIRASHGAKLLRGGNMHVWQIVVFGLAIFLLFVLDAMFIMIYMVKNGVPIAAWYTLAVLYLIYLAMMATALFPVRHGNQESETWA